MRSLKLISHSLEETLKLGFCLGNLAEAGDIFLLSGPLGAGKTCLTQGIARGLGSKEYALSPTFVLMREIEGRLTLYHIDLYRLDRIEEIIDLGLVDVDHDFPRRDRARPLVGDGDVGAVAGVPIGVHFERHLGGSRGDG